MDELGFSLRMDPRVGVSYVPSHSPQMAQFESAHRKSRPLGKRPFAFLTAAVRASLSTADATHTAKGLGLLSVDAGRAVPGAATALVAALLDRDVATCARKVA